VARAISVNTIPSGKELVMPLVRRRPTAIAAPVAHLVGPGKLKLANGRLVFATEERTQPALDYHALRAVYCYGPVGITDDALETLFRAGIAVSWLSSGGQFFRGQLTGPHTDSTLLRVGQHRFLADPERRCVTTSARERVLAPRSMPSALRAIARPSLRPWKSSGALKGAPRRPGSPSWAPR
jgi:hypothetical protein